VLSAVFFILTFLAIAALTLFFTVNTSLKSVKRDVDDTQIDALISRGINYVYREMSRVAGFAWVTHEIPFNCDPFDPDPTVCPSPIPTTGSPVVLAPLGTRPSIFYTTEGRFVNEAAGEYYYTLNGLADGVLKIITYREFYPLVTTSAYAANPWEFTGVVVIRVLANFNGKTKAVEYRVSNTSVFEFFSFFSGPERFSDTTGVIYDGGGFGKIHVNLTPSEVAAGLGITLRYDTVFKDLASLTTNGYIKLYNYQLDAPYDRDVTSTYFWDNSTKDAKAPMVVSDDGLSPAMTDMIMNMFYHFNYNRTGDYTSTPTYMPRWQNSDLTLDVPIPYYFPGASATWSWDKYSGNPPANEETVRFFVPGFEMQRLLGSSILNDMPGWTNYDQLYDDDGPAGHDPWTEYWKNKYRRYWAAYMISRGISLSAAITDYNNDAQWAAARPSRVNKEWWDDLIYGDDRVNGSQDDYGGSTETEDVNFLNTEEQISSWQAWLVANPDVNIREANSGGREEQIQKIDTSFRRQAIEGGLYVKYDSSTLSKIQGDYNGDNEVNNDDKTYCQSSGCVEGQSCGACPHTDWYDRVEVNDGLVAGEGDVNDLDGLGISTNEMFWNPIYPGQGSGDDCADGLCKTKILVIDVGELTSKINSGVITDFNGVIYIEDLKPDDIEKYDFGVVLTNGSQLPPQGLTVVTPHNLYVKGNYNITKVDPDTGAVDPVNGIIPGASVVSSHRKIYTLSDSFNGFDTDFADATEFPFFPARPINYPAHVFTDDDTTDLFDIGTTTEVSTFILNSNPGSSGDYASRLASITSGAVSIIELTDGDDHTWIYARDKNGGLYKKNFYHNPPTSAQKNEFISKVKDVGLYWHEDNVSSFNSARSYFTSVTAPSTTSGYSDYFTDIATNTTYNMGMVSPYDPKGYILERWSGKIRNIIGAFIEVPGQDPTPFYTTHPYVYDYHRNRGYGYYYNYTSGTWHYYYNTSFANPSDLILPPGEFTAASSSTWRVIDPLKFKEL